MSAISLRQPQIPINPVGGAVAKGQPNATGAKHRREHPETGLIGICGAEKKLTRCLNRYTIFVGFGVVARI